MSELTSEDRRSLVRGNFFFEVKFSIITPEEHKRIKRSKKEKFSLYDGKLQRPDIAQAYARRDTNTDPNLVRFLLQMDEKLDRILTMLPGDKGEKGEVNRGIGTDIGGSGMKMIVDNPVEPHQILHTSFVLSRFPLVFTDAFGEVVRVTPVDDEGKRMYHLGLKFLDLNLSDRENIIACVFQKQREAIRKRKSAGLSNEVLETTSAEREDG